MKPLAMRRGCCPSDFVRPVTLHDRLVRTVAGHREKGAANQSGPKRVFGGKIPGKIEDLQFVSRCRAPTCDLMPAARNAVNEEKQGNHAASEIEGKLCYIGPDHGFHSPFKSVQHGQRNDDKHRQRSLVPSTALTTSAIAETRTPSARVRVTRKVRAAIARTRRPNLRSINAYAVKKSPRK